MPMLSDELRIPADHPLLQRYLKSLSREALVGLAVEWSQADTALPCLPVLDLDAPASVNIQTTSPTLEAVREVYGSLLNDKANKQEIIERMTTVDWKPGFSLWQLARIDRSLLREKPDSLTWNAFRIRRTSVRHDIIYQKFVDPVPVQQVKIIARQIVDGFEEELGLLLNMHCFASDDGPTGFSLIRIAIAGDYDILDESKLCAADGGHLLLGSFWLAFRSSAMEIYHSTIPSQISVARDVKTLVTDAIGRILSFPQGSISLEVAGDTERSLIELDRKTRGWSTTEWKDSLV